MEAFSSIRCEFNLNRNTLAISTAFDGRPPFPSTIEEAKIIEISEKISKWNSDVNRRSQVLGTRVLHNRNSTISPEDQEIATILFELLLSDERQRRQFESLASNPSSDHLVIYISHSDSIAGNFPWESIAHADWNKLGIRQLSNRIAVVRTPFTKRFDFALVEPIRVLVISSSAYGEGMVNANKEIEAIEKGLSYGFGRLDNSRCKIVEHIDRFNPTEFKKGVEVHEPHIIHLITHGAPGILNGEDDRGKVKSFPTHSFSSVAKETMGKTSLLVSTACSSMKFDEKHKIKGIGSYFSNSIPMIIGMQSDITPKMVNSFTRTLYGSLAKSKSVVESYIDAREKVFEDNKKSPDWIAPVLYQSGKFEEGLFLPPLDAFLKRVISELDDRYEELQEDMFNRSSWNSVSELINQIENKFIRGVKKKKYQIKRSKREEISNLRRKIVEFRGEILTVFDLIDARKKSIGLGLKHEAGRQLSNAHSYIQDIIDILENIEAT